MKTSRSSTFDPLLTTGLPSTSHIAFYSFCKRSLDVLLSGPALVCLSPVFLLVAILIKFEDGGKIFYSSPRVGRKGKLFFCLKFRSMVMNADKKKEEIRALNQHADDRTFKLKHDPRITEIGRIIRRYSVDELPQLWNVFRGDMSIVGPRPALPDEVDRYKEADFHRFDVLPGLTCIWQVSGRGDIPFDQQVLMDLDYIASQGFWTDVKLILKTFPVVFSGKGAY